MCHKIHEIITSLYVWEQRWFFLPFWVFKNKTSHKKTWHEQLTFDNLNLPLPSIRNQSLPYKSSCCRSSIPWLWPLVTWMKYQRARDPWWSYRVIKFVSLFCQIPQKQTYVREFGTLTNALMQSCDTISIRPPTNVNHSSLDCVLEMRTCTPQRQLVKLSVQVCSPPFPWIDGYIDFDKPFS